MALYSYILRYDTGDAPNPYGGVCTLTVCKPDIRRTAQVDDWILGTGSKCSPVGNVAGYLVYAMKVSKKLTMADYDAHCQRELAIKIPGSYSEVYENYAGDSLYDYTNLTDDMPQHRGGLVHQELELQKRDWRGKYALLSNHFYYFGSEPRELPESLQCIVKRNQGHYRRTDPNEIALFESWLQQQGFEQNKIYATPQAPVWNQVAALPIDTLTLPERSALSDISSARPICN